MKQGDAYIDTSMTWNINKNTATLTLYNGQLPRGVYTIEVIGIGDPIRKDFIVY